MRSARARSRRASPRPDRRTVCDRGPRTGAVLRRAPRGPPRVRPSERLPDRRQHGLLDGLVRRHQGLVLVDPHDPLALEQGALHGDRRAIAPRRLELDHEPMAGALRVDAVVLAVDRAGLGVDPAAGLIRLLDVPSELLEHGRGRGPHLLGGRRDRLRDGLAGERRERDRAEYSSHGGHPHDSSTPPRSRYTALAPTAASGRWLTITTAAPARARPRSASRITAPLASSRLPVGSSASRSGGSFSTARQNATRCCSPPESCAGKWSIRSPTPTSCRSSIARRRVAPPRRRT